MSIAPTTENIFTTVGLKALEFLGLTSSGLAGTVAALKDALLPYLADQFLKDFGKWAGNRINEIKYLWNNIKW